MRIVLPDVERNLLITHKASYLTEWFIVTSRDHDDTKIHRPLSGIGGSCDDKFMLCIYVPGLIRLPHVASVYAIGEISANIKIIGAYKLGRSRRGRQTTTDLYV